MAQEKRRERTSERRTGEHAQRSAPRRRRQSAGSAVGFGVLYEVAVIGASILLACIIWIAANDVLALNKAEHSATVVLDSDRFTYHQEENADGILQNVATADMGYVADVLEENGLIEYKLLFRMFAAFTGGSDKIKPGTYELDTDMDYRALISGMSSSSANRVEVQVTIPEGYTVEQIFQLLEEHEVASADDLREMAANYDYGFSFLQDIPLGDASRLEGYLFPDTYNFYVNHDPKYVINRMLQRFDQVFTEEMRTEVEESGRTIHEVLTVASLIERETDGDDQGEIASVIYNRLNNPNGETAGYLQIDATLVYINGGNVPTDADRSIDSPYNTYLYKGLPPGPIANPGLESIQAAMNPEDTSYFYYALGDDGQHHFFQTYNQLQNFLASQEMYENS